MAERTALDQPGGQDDVRRARRGSSTAAETSCASSASEPRTASCSRSATPSNSSRSGTARRRSAPSPPRRTRSCSRRTTRTTSSTRTRGSSWSTRRPTARSSRVAGGRHILVVDDAFRERLDAQPDELEPAPTTKDDIALWKFTTGSTGQPKGAVHPVHSPVLSHEWYARGVLGIREDDVVLPVPKLFFGYARDLTALYPFGVGAAGIVFPERTTPERIFELIAEHRPTILVNVPTMMAQMIDSVRHGRCQTPDMSCLRMCTSAGEALPRELHDRWLDTFGVEVLDGIGSSELYHIYISNRPGRAPSREHGRARAGLRGRARRERRAARHRRHCRAPLLGRRREDEAHVQRRHGPHGRPLRARRRRLLLVPRPRRRPDQGGWDVGRAGRDRALPRRAIRTSSSAR